MCMAKYGFAQSRAAQITRIYNEWDLDGESLREATEDQFVPMGEVGLIIYIQAACLKTKEASDSVGTHVGDELSDANPCLAVTFFTADYILLCLVVCHLLWPH